MTSKSYDRLTLLVLVFDEDSQAYEALQELKALNKEKRIKIKAAAVVTKKQDGNVKVKPKVLALVEPLWIQDFVQALHLSPLTPAPHQQIIGPDLDLENPDYSPIAPQTVYGELPPMAREEYEAPQPQ